MRLRNIYVICKENLEKIDALTSSTCADNSSYVKVSNWMIVSDAIRKSLGSIKFLEEEAHELMQSVPEIYRIDDSFKIHNSDWDKIKRAKNQLRDCMVDVINLYESMEINTDEHIGIDIKLPECNDFSDLKKYIDELDFILYKCPFFKVENETLKFNTVDVGSMWLTFAVLGVGAGVASALANNIAAFIDKCMVIKSHKITLEQQKKQLEFMQMEKDAKESLIEGLEKIFESQVNSVISNLEKETGIVLKDGEERGIASTAFEKANAMLDKGMQLYSTIDSPNEIKSLFEPLEMKYLSISENLKLLEKKDDNEE